MDGIYGGRSGAGTATATASIGAGATALRHEGLLDRMSGLIPSPRPIGGGMTGEERLEVAIFEGGFVALGEGGFDGPWAVGSGVACEEWLKIAVF